MECQDHLPLEGQTASSISAQWLVPGLPTAVCSMQYSVVEWHLVLIYVTSQLLLMQSCLMFWYSIAMI